MRYGGSVLDAHAHVMEGAPGAEKLLAIEKQYGYEACCALGATAWGGAAQNAQCLLVKLLSPGCYAFGGMNHTQGDFGEQCRQLLAMGADGFKIIEGKPDVYREVGKSLDSPCYDALYAFAQEHGLPVLAHVGDPPEFWDLSKAPRFAVENGWTYADESFPTPEELFGQVERVAGRYPRLRLILAHFFFLSQDLERASAFLDRHPCVCFDLCPGTEMYENFSREPERARAFFLRYQDRLLFGTDNWDTEDPQEIRDKDEINRMVRRFLEDDGTFPVWDHTMTGIDLPVSVLEKLYGGNFRRLAGEKPRPVSRRLLAEHCAALSGDPERFGLREGDEARLQSVLRALEE